MLYDLLLAKSLNGGGGGGGSAFFFVNVTIGEYDADEEAYICTADKTPVEVYNAYTSGMIPVVKLADNNISGGNILFPTYIVSEEEDLRAEFRACGFSSENYSDIIDISYDGVGFFRYGGTDSILYVRGYKLF